MKATLKKNNVLQKTRYYFDDYEKEINATNHVITQIDYIFANNDLVALRRKSASGLTSRGFTLHEHIDEMNLINMNARIYDPALGHFISVDPLAEKYYSMSPYTYCGGNPLMRVDPSGEDYWSTSNPAEIEKFWDAYHRNYSSDGGSWINFSSWETHYTDEEFLSLMGAANGNLTYNDENGRFYTSYSYVENNEIVVVGVSIASYMFTDIMARINPLASGRLEQTNFEFDLLFSGTKMGRYIVKEFLRSLFNSSSATTNTFDANKSGFSKVARGNHKDDGLRHLSDHEISSTLKSLKGNLTKEQKAFKQRLTKEQKTRTKRNVQKKSGEKGGGSGRRR